MKLPRQPLRIDRQGTVRFKANRVVTYLLDHGGIDMNHLAIVAERHGWTKDERAQFAQLIGYSASGYGDLSYVTRSEAEAVDALADQLLHPPGRR